MTHYDHPARIMAAEAQIAALQAALREALEEWSIAENSHCCVYASPFSMDRIAALRAQFLDDK